jgi:hypothetical protein
LITVCIAPRRKYGETINAAALNSLIDECESWLYDNPDISLGELREKFNSIKSETTQSLCKEYFDAIEREKVELENALQAEAQKAEAERKEEGL